LTSFQFSINKKPFSFRGCRLYSPKGFIIFL